MKITGISLFIFLLVFVSSANQTLPPMLIERGTHDSVSIDSTRILVAGGMTLGAATLSDSEVYNSATNSWKRVPMSYVRDGVRIIKLDDGRIAAFGGISSTGVITAVVEIFDPSQETWSPGGTLVYPRASGHTITKLNDGRILITGGSVDPTDGTPYKVITNKTEIYDPATQTSQAAASTNFVRNVHTATLLADGRVLVLSTGNAEIYDPSANTWTLGTPLNFPRFSHTANLLPSGKVLVAGGSISALGNFPGNNVEIYDVSTGTSQVIASLSAKRTNHRSAVRNEKIYITGGYDSSGLKSVEIFDPSTNSWTPGQPMVTARYVHSVAVLGNEIIVTGGVRTHSLNQRRRRHQFRPRSRLRRRLRRQFLRHRLASNFLGLFLLLGHSVLRQTGTTPWDTISHR
jgi:hypothetical protein